MMKNIMTMLILVGVLSVSASAAQMKVDTNFEPGSAGAGSWTIPTGWNASLVGEVDPESNVAWEGPGDTPQFANVVEGVDGQNAFMNGSDVARLRFAGDTGNDSGVFTTTAMMLIHPNTDAGQYAFLMGRNGGDGTGNAWKISWEIRLHNTTDTAVALRVWDGSTLTTLVTGLSEDQWYDVRIDADYDAQTYDVYYRSYGSGTWLLAADDIVFVAENAGYDDWGGGDAFQALDFGSPGTGGVMFDNIVVELADPPDPSALRAFPTAEGYGCNATGGRGGDVYHVTSLYDTETPGTLRYGIVSAAGPRTIVFDISGTIALSDYLDITNDNITIAGQTAPGDGICLKNFALKINADDIIVRHMRFRPGHQAAPLTETDAVSILDGNDIILDHCSLTWAVDENLGVGNSNIARSDVTIQWCIMSEGLTDPFDQGGGWGHSMAALLSPTNGNLCRVSMHHNIMSQNYKRNPYCAPYDNADIILDLRNNVVYNWGHKSIYAGAWNDPERDDVQMNLVGNYLIAGDDTDDFYAVRAENTSIQGDIEFYRSGNYIDNDRDENLDGHPWYSSNIYGNYTALGSPLSCPAVTTHTALQAYSLVLEQAGAGATVQSVAERDSVDSRIVNDIETHDGGLIDLPSEVGGWPTLSSYTTRTDSDQDGMPDFWENEFLLNPNDASDRNDDADGDGYTNLEEYLSWLIDEGDFSLPLVKECGHWGYLVGDTNKDCYVDLTDIAALAELWLSCTNPLDSDCASM
ncbi:MAG: hypothetical protein K8R02_00080 [Anaerohalosphaeraceae bacterium]|nr:hypothetical protein [Anaerohalosphaeraceae bacterium]